MDEGILLSSFYGLVFFISVIRSLSECQASPRNINPKSCWILYGKLFLLLSALSVSIANLVYIFQSHVTVPISQSYILEPISLLGVILFTYFNHTRSRNSSSTLLLYWPLYAVALGIWARTVITQNSAQLHVPLTLRCVSGGLGLLSFALECIGPEFDQKTLEGEKNCHENPIITANIFSVWLFSWMTPLMRKGASQYVTEDDLPDIKQQDECERLGEKLKKALKKHSLWKSLFIAYGAPYCSAAILKLIQDSLAFLQPQLLRWLLSYISLYQSARLWDAETPGKPHPLQGFCIAFIMFVASTAQTIILNQYFQYVFETGMRVRAGLISALYEKALVLSNDELSRSTGDIVNYMSVDATRLQDFCTFGLIALSGPFQITLAFISLYNLLGWPAFVGVAIMVFSVPLNTVIARILKKMQQQQMKNRDKRTRLMSELLANIKSIKLYGWEFAFARKVLQVRNDQELVMLRKIGVVTSLNSMLWGGIPLLVAFSSFAVAAITSDKPLTSDVIFPAISLFMLLQFPLQCQVTSNIIEAIVSLQRLSEFLGARELQPDTRKLIAKQALQPGEEVLTIKNADFSWSSSAVEPTLDDINLTVRKGELVGVLGRVGAGKTSLLAAIIGDMSRQDGEIVVKGNIAYAPQNPWIMSATVRDNILFNHEYDETFYNLVIEACALLPDLALLASGDLTEVGEKVSPITSNDRRPLISDEAKVIGPQGLLATKARILVTNSIAFVKQFDQLVFIRRGIILENGSYDELMSKTDGEVTRLVRGHGSQTSGTSTPYVTTANGSGSATPIGDDTSLDDLKGSQLVEKLRHRTSFSKARMASAAPTRVSISTGLSKEHQEQGRVKPHVYTEYIKAASKFGFFMFMFTTVASQAVSVLGNLALRGWGEHNRQVGSNEGMLKYLLLYGLLSLSSTLLSGASGVIIWMLDALIRAPLSFFELTPTGRILNLFSRDIYVVDQILARVFQNTWRTLTTTLFIAIVIGFSFPLFLLSIIPLGWFYLRVMKYYLATSRELKRLDAVSRSPIFAWFSESLAGLSTIRAFGQQSTFATNSNRRVDRNQICYLSSISVNRWLSVRLEIVGAFIILLVAVLSVVALTTSGVDAGLVGLVLSYAMNATSSLIFDIGLQNWVVRSASEVEQNIVSVERILHQSSQSPEAPSNC
ncbi:hypothetical protein D9758_007166 [Tetrapyrgos nigripes]|uniref:Uncharacterized protein n=1 Tax=Tetrapyrgos nigripes TaxID=182062 RepID=A0A8H5FVS4_9AGAR|nr:hypothetical protein D9758_007166 [Tetrapyrgos nigripes]